MKRFRIFLSTLLFVSLGTACSFAETVTETAKKDFPWEIVAVVIVVVLIAFNEIRRSKNDRDDKNRR